MRLIEILLFHVLAIQAIGLWLILHWLRRISGRLGRLPQRIIGTADEGKTTYYAKDEP